MRPIPVVLARHLGPEVRRGRVAGHSVCRAALSLKELP